jgi:hypothetical protein
MPSSGMWRRVALVRTDRSEEHIASIIKVETISELGMLAETTVHRSLILFTLMTEAIYSSEMSVFNKSLTASPQKTAFSRANLLACSD